MSAPQFTLLIQIAGLSALTFALAWWLTAQFARGRWLVAMDHPNERSLHASPTPRTGGLAIVLAVFAAQGSLIWLYGASLDGALMAAAVLAVLLVSIVDDLRNVAVRWRLGVHIAAALLVLGAGVTLKAIALPGAQWTIPAPLAGAVSLLVVLWLVNLYNFMDGLDGLAGGMGLIGFTALAVLGARAGDWSYASTCAVIAAACAGFLVLNFAPARIFMGDAGSSVLGLVAAIAALKADRDGLFALWLSVLVFSPFIVDATVTLLRRLIAGEKIWQAHRSHFYQRLVAVGWSHRRTCLFEYALMLACAGSAVLIENAEASLQGVVLLTWAATYGILMLTITVMERRHASS